MCVGGNLCDVSLSFLGQDSEGRTVPPYKQEWCYYTSENRTVPLYGVIRCKCVSCVILCEEQIV